MKLLLVCSQNSGRIVPFIVEQAESLKRLGFEVDFFCIEGKGLLGYLKNYLPFRAKIRSFRPDIIHAHYGLSCLFANLQRSVPVVSTYHGTDINNDAVFKYSQMAIRMSAYNVFVSEKNLKKAAGIPGTANKNVLIPCGVDGELFVPVDKNEARQKTGLKINGNYVLFSGAFDNEVKNPSLAKSVVEMLDDVDLIELKGYTRQQVALLMNAVDVVLMTSHTEGSPQFIKEAVACNCPVVSVPVGDVPELVSGIDGCFIASYDKTELSRAVAKVLDSHQRTSGRTIIYERKLELMQVAEKLNVLYQKLSEKK